MGVDWIPCRVDLDVDPVWLKKIVLQEFLSFTADPGWIHYDLWPLLGFNPFVKDDSFEPAPPCCERLADSLLFKRDARRVYEVTGCQLLPVQWRLHAYRTFLPDQLKTVFERWTDYREAVSQGSYRGLLEETYWYLQAIECGQRLAEAKSTMRDSLERTDSWTGKVEVSKARDTILELADLPVPQPPLEDLTLARSVTLDQRWSELTKLRDSLSEAIDQWNFAVRRNRWHINPLSRWAELEVWIQNEIALESNWNNFVRWVNPWIEKGYGLYRDCERCP